MRWVTSYIMMARGTAVFPGRSLPQLALGAIQLTVANIFVTIGTHETSVDWPLRFNYLVAHLKLELKLSGM